MPKIETIVNCRLKFYKSLFSGFRNKCIIFSHVFNMAHLKKSLGILITLYCVIIICDSAKINTPRVLLPWFENLNVNFTFEIHEGGCYTWYVILSISNGIISQF